MNRRDFFAAGVALPVVGSKPEQVIDSVYRVSGSDDLYALVLARDARRAGLKTGDRRAGCFVVVV